MNVAANMTNIIPSTSVPVIGPILNGCTKRNMMVKILSIIIAMQLKSSKIKAINAATSHKRHIEVNAICSGERPTSKIGLDSINNTIRFLLRFQRREYEFYFTRYYLPN
jgi:hypothetical protein